MFRKAQWQSAVDEYNKCNLDDSLKENSEVEQAAAVYRQQEIMRVSSPCFHRNQLLDLLCSWVANSYYGVSSTSNSTNVYTMRMCRRKCRAASHFRPLISVRYRVKGFAAQCNRTLYDLLQARSIGSMYYPKNRSLEPIRQQGM